MLYALCECECSRHAPVWLLNDVFVHLPCIYFNWYFCTKIQFVLYCMTLIFTCSLVLPHFLSWTPSGCWRDVCVSLYEALRRRRDVSASPGSLPSPTFRGQRLQRPVPPSRDLASTPASTERLRDLQRHLHPAHSEPPSPAKDPSEHVFSGNHGCFQPHLRSWLPASVAGFWRFVPAQPSSSPWSTRRSCSIADPAPVRITRCSATPALSHTYAHGRLSLLNAGRRESFLIVCF